MKIKNDEIKFNIIKNGKVINSKTFHNRILDNYFEFFYRKIFFNQDLFTKFEWKIQRTPTQYCYLKFGSTQTITDSSKTMSYDEKINIQDTSKYMSIETGTNFFKVTNYFDFDITATYDGIQLYGVGFGQDDTTNPTNYLLAFTDVEDLEISLLEGQTLQIVRQDTISCDGTFIAGTTNNGSFPFHLGFYKDITNTSFIYADLYSIEFYHGEYIDKEYLIDDLTKVYNNNEIVLSGFDNFMYFGGTSLYPSETLYPSDDLYPTPTEPTYTKCRYTYKIHNLYDYMGETIDVISDTYYIDKSLIQQTIEENDGILTSKYKFERGDI